MRGKTRIGWRESYQITMAGLAATRLFAAAGAGGVALTAWALRRSGMERRVVACRTVAFLVLLYVVYVGAIVVVGLGLYFGLFPGPAPFAITVRARDHRLSCVIALFLALTLLPGDVERRIAHWAARLGARARALAKVVDDAGLGGRRRAHRDRARARPRMGRARRGRLVGLRHRGAVGVLPRLRPSRRRSP